MCMICVVELALLSRDVKLFPKTREKSEIIIYATRPVFSRQIVVIFEVSFLSLTTVCNYCNSAIKWMSQHSFFESFRWNTGDGKQKHFCDRPKRGVNRDLKQEEAFKKTRRSTGKFPFKWNRGWLNFNSLAAASS